MADKLILIDVNNTIVKDQRDVSEYVFEAIRSRYGLEAQFKLDDYEGVPAQLMIADILEKNGVTKEEINSRLEGCAEELGYSYYNVVGHEPITVQEGARKVLDEFDSKSALIGIATGDIEDVIKNKLQRAELFGRFRFGEYGNKETDLSRILENAAARSVSEFGLQDGAVACVLASYPQMIRAAKSISMRAVGVASGRYSREELAKAGADETVDSMKDKSRIIRAALG